MNPCLYVSSDFIWLPREHGPQNTFLDLRKLYKIKKNLKFACHVFNDQIKCHINGILTICLIFHHYMLVGDKMSRDHIPAACKDSVAMLFMFDLTSRCTLNK